MDRSYGLQAIGPDTTDFTRMFPELILSNREDMKWWISYNVENQKS